MGGLACPNNFLSGTAVPVGGTLLLARGLPTHPQVPDWMLSLKKVRPKERRLLEVSVPNRRRISTTTGWDLQKAHKKAQAIQRSKAAKGGKRRDAGSSTAEPET